MRRLLALFVVLGVVTVQAQGILPPALTSASLSTTTCPGAGCVTLKTSNYAGIGIQVTGSWSGTLAFQATTDGTNYVALNCSAANSTTAVTTTTANGLWKCGITGVGIVQVVFTSYASGTAVVTMQAATAADGSGTSAAGSGSNAAAGATGSPVPASASYTGINSSGTLVGVPGDVTNGMYVNCKAGCAAASDTTSAAASITSGSGNGSTYPNGPAPSGLALAGDGGAAFQLAASGTLIATITPQCSTDGGTTYFNSYFQDFFTGALTTTQTIASGQAVTAWQVLCPQGSSHAQLKATAFTSGSGSFTGRATVSGWPPVDLGVVTTAAPTYTTGQIAPNSLTTAGALRVDNSAVTQPISAASLPLPTGASTAAKQPALGTAGTASADVITVQGIASMTKLLVTPDSVALPANQSVNVAQLAGTTTDTNSGTKSAGTLRVVLATDQPALTNKLLVTPDSVALPANQSVNVAQMNGVTTTMNTGNSDTGTQRVALATNNPAIATWGHGATGAAVPANATYLGGNGSGNTTGLTVCDTRYAISVTANTQMITGTSAKHIYICSINLVVAAATNVAIVSGTGTVCATGIGGVFGGTTAATGWNFAANGGLAQGTGVGWIGRTVATGDNLCILVSAANQTSGGITYTVY
jgi:hypothetical protein